MKNNKLRFLSFLIIYFLFTSCQKEKIGSGANISDLFYLENKGAKMPILVEGNIDSGVILFFVHGGPGGTAIGFQNDEFISSIVECKYAVAYMDQRGAGGSQGSNTPKLELSLFIEDLKKGIILTKNRYGSDKQVFLISHSWGGLIAAGFLTDGNNQHMLKGWINVAGAHNYYNNDSLTRAYLISFGQDQIAKNIHKTEWEEIVSYAEAHPANYTYETSLGLNMRAGRAEGYINDISHTSGGISDLFKNDKTAFSLFWALSNAGGTFISGLNQKIMHAEFSSKLSSITIPLICITGKYDFTVPKGLADEVMLKASSIKKSLVILPNSGHICMSNEPEAFYEEVIKFIEDNR